MLDGVFKARLVGPVYAHRYVIRDDREPGPDRFWTGKGWTRKLKRAIKFSDPSRMTTALFRLTSRHFARLYPRRRYRLKVNVDVYGPWYVSQEDVEDFVRKALVFGIDYQTHGTGPNPDTTVIVSIPTTELKPVG